MQTDKTKVGKVFVPRRASFACTPCTLKAIKCGLVKFKPCSSAAEWLDVKVFDEIYAEADNNILVWWVASRSHDMKQMIDKVTLYRKEIRAAKELRKKL